MIKIKFFRNNKGNISAFEISNHGKDIVCAAVSALSLNAVNSVEALTEDSFHCEYEEKGGYLRFEFEKPDISQASVILMESLYLGLKSIKEQYKSSISISEEVLK